ncbi:uncharacterized protein LOC112451590, partial [Temnothorax curvispinosus]|uniref:Uncharacterized protein LOC112451590 n=1 Tax=Temnothorax curvispinosus TaxID=300111 RepID=A0A6J1PC06_9HYME
NDQISNLNVKTAEDIISKLFDKTDKISLCQEELSTVDSSLINGQISFDEKKDDTIDDSFYKFKQENSKDTKLVKCVTQRNDQVTNFDTKEIEEAINRLLDKVNLKSFPFNKGQSNKISSTTISPSMNKFANCDIKKTNEVIGTLFNNFGKENRENPCRMQPCTAVSPLLCCALQKINEKNCTPTILAYLAVTVHTLHCQVVPDLLVYMATDLINLPVYKYLQSWSSNKQPISLKDKLPSLRLLHELSSILLADSKILLDLIEFSKLFNDGHSTYCFKYSGKEVTIKYSLSLYDVKTLLKMTVFYLAQLAQSKILRQNENCKLMLAFLLSIQQSIGLNQNNVAILEGNARCIFTHFILLHYFSPFCEEISKDSVEYMITETILKVCESVLN